MTFLIDFTKDVSMSPRSPSDVPEDCIMRCIVRRSDLRTEAREKGRLPADSDQENSLRCRSTRTTSVTYLNLAIILQIAIDLELRL